MKKCATCDKKMQKLELLDSHIDLCDTCESIFLNKGELLAIDNFLEKIDQEKIPKGLKRSIQLQKDLVNAEFEIQKQDKLHKIIDEIPGIKYIASFLSLFF